MKNSIAIAFALFVAITTTNPVYAQNAQSGASASGSVLEIPSASLAPPDPTVSDSFKDDAAAPNGDTSTAASLPTSVSSGGASAGQPANDSGIAENDQNAAESHLEGAQDPSYAGVSEYLNQQSDYASYASAYSGLPPAALIGPSPFVRYFVFRSMIASSAAYPPPSVVAPIPFRSFGPGFGPPVFRYYAPPPPHTPSFGGAFGGRGFGGRVGFSHR
jgi:hypothetical protein